jgi:hypothetical protein
VTSEPGNRRYLLRVIVALLVLAVVVAVVLANRYRDAIAREVANRVLADSDVTVVDVSVASIRADNVRFEMLLIELANGTEVRVEGITLPVKFRGFASTTLGIESVIVRPGDGPSDPLRLADSLRAFLDAPAAMPGGAIVIDELTIPNLPPIRRLGWYADTLNPTLRANVGDFELFLTLTPDEDDDYRGTFRALAPNDHEVILFAFRVGPAASGFEIAGSLALQLEPLLPVLHAIEAVPIDVTRLAATVIGDLDLALSNELPVTVNAAVDSVPGMNLDYRTSGDRLLHLTVRESAPLAATFEYPTLQWKAAVPSAVLAVDAGDVEFPPLRLENAVCRSGIHCRADLATAIRDISIGIVSLERIAFSASAFQFVSEDGEWRGNSDAVTACFENLSIAGYRVVPPGIKAALSVTAKGLSASLDATTPEGGFTGRIDIEHDLARNTGIFRIANTALDFTILNLSEALLDRELPFDVTSGYWRINSEVNWAIGDAGFAYTGSSTHALDELAGRYGETGFVGLGTEFDVAIDWQAEPSFSPATLEVALVDVGFPIEHLHGRITPDLGALAADIDGVTMSLLGGEVRIDPFRYEFEKETNDLLLRARGIQLPLMVGLADLEAVEISGSVSGEIPVTLKNGAVIVEGGHLENDAPGGAIRYDAGTGIVDEDSQLGIVTRTLKNFEFDVLTSNVDYNEQGDLKLQMRLTGTNPDVDPLQPVVLNLGIENNVPQMLRSLQATRSIEEIIESRLGQ